ncbi:MAG: PAS domain S-box protein [Planctomycetes bacterium]|nr:PAS domain S-box protein [Planctomycetota bacterium]
MAQTSDGLAEHIATPEENREREARLQAILDTAVEAIITIDDRGVCESVNAAAEVMFGYSTEEIIGKNITLLMPAPFRQEHDQYLSNYLQTGQKKIIGIGRESVGRRKNGEEFPIHLAVSEVKFADRRLFTGIIQDRTEQKESHRRLVQSERLAVLGEAMARLAHESRNPLQRIQIAVETARLHCEADSSLANQLDSIERASDGLDALFDELKNYAAPLNLEKERVSLVTIWREAWRATSRSRRGREAELLEHVGDTEPVCYLDRYRMGQVLRNLFENSLSACQDPVQVEIGVSETHTDSATSWKLRIRDNGPGLNKQQQERIFEPFYTTKTKGTGLGMAIAHRILEAHEGKISVGRVDQGAEFIIELPR